METPEYLACAVLIAPAGRPSVSNHAPVLSPIFAYWGSTLEMNRRSAFT